MGRKRTVTTAEATTQSPGNGQGQGSSAESTGQERPKNKTAAVKEAMGKGIKSPKDIAEYAKNNYGMSISEAYVSTIKGNLKRAKAGKRPPGRPPKQKAAEGEGSTRVKAADGGAGGLRAKDVEALADIAERAGGIDQLQQLLATMKRMR
jgi:hypothetical protein